MKRMIVFVSALFLLPAIAPAQQTSWQWVNPLPQGNLLNGVYAISKDTAFAVTELGGVLRTTNGGITWQVMPEVGGNPLQLFAVKFISSTTGWMTGEGGTVFKTTNCGE